MLATALSFALSLAPQGPSTAPVVINEFLYDDFSSDNAEFVELFNRSAAPVDISGWTLDAEDATTTNPSYTIPAATVLQPGERYTIGADAASPGNINLVVGTTNLWENGTESLTLRDGGATIVDSVVYESAFGTGLWNPALAEGPGILARFVPSSSTMQSWQRIEDGYDSDNNGRDFWLAPATPAAPNYAERNYPLEETYDQLSPGDPVPGYTGSFQPAFVVDPLVAGPSLNGRDINPSPIPLSNHDGNVVIIWDPSGGGNAVMHDNQAIKNVSIRADVYVDGTPAPPGEGESWHIGTRGTVDGFAHHVQVGASSPFGGNWSPGVTGVGCYYLRDENGANLYVIDYGDGSQVNVLHTIPVVAGVSDGWRRFMFVVHDNLVYLFWEFQEYYATTNTTEPGGVFFSYRENFIDHANARPLTMDQVRILDADAGTSYVGTGVAHNFGTPTIVTNSPPSYDNPTFAILGSGFVPNGLPQLGVGVQDPNPIDIGAIGGIPGAIAHVFMIAVIPSPADPSGNATWPIPIPNDITLFGSITDVQAFDLDVTYPAAIPFAVSAMMKINVGR